MSFWDEFAANEPAAGTDLHSLISSPTPDFNAVLESNELLNLFRQRDENLVQYVTSATVFPMLLDIMLTHENSKISKKVCELFVCKDQNTQTNSPLLLQLIKDQESSEKFIFKSIESGDHFRIGLMSRIYITSLTSPQLKDDFASLFNTSIDIVGSLTNGLHHTAVEDLLSQYLDILKPEEQWLLFAYLQMLLPKGKSASCPKCFIKFKNLIIGLIKHLATSKTASSIKKKVGMVHLMSVCFKKSKHPDVVSSILPMLSLIFDSFSKDDTNTMEDDDAKTIKLLILELALEFPPEKTILNLAANLIKAKSGASQPYDQLSIAALNLLSSSPSKSLNSLLPAIVRSFSIEKTNTFHFIAFVHFIKSVVEVPELAATTVKELEPIIISDCSGSAKWRENAAKVAFLLQIAVIIDSFVDKNDEKWKIFRECDLQKWQKRDDEKTDAPPPIAAIGGQSKSSIKIDSVDIPKVTGNGEKVGKTEIVGNQANVEKIGTDFDGEFPKFDEENNKTGDLNGGFSFPDVDMFPKVDGNNNNNDNGLIFPNVDSFPKVNDNNDSDDSNDNNNLEKKKDFDFPDINEFQQAENGSMDDKGGFAFPSADVFPKFDEDNNKENGGFAFPNVDSFPKDDESNGNKNDFGFPSADNFSKVNENFDDNNKSDFGFPDSNAFPTIDDGNDGGFKFPDVKTFPKVGDDDFNSDENQKEKETNFGFPTENEFAATENRDDDESFGFPQIPISDVEEERRKTKPANKNDKDSFGFEADTQFNGGAPKIVAKNKETEVNSNYENNVNNNNENNEKNISDKNISDNDGNNKDEDEEEESDDDGFESLQKSSTTTITGDVNKPAMKMPVVMAAAHQSEPVDVSFENFLKLIDNPCWEYSGPTPAELFGQKDPFSTAEEAFDFLVGQA